jgi:hypothetical protein
MDDRELLELAAKAAEIPFSNIELVWNPITDDGDALRLAVTLKIIVGRYDNYVNAAPLHDGAKEVVIWNHNEKDPYAATRRAMVRAAAEIGKGM